MHQWMGFTELFLSNREQKHNERYLVYIPILHLFNIYSFVISCLRYYMWHPNKLSLCRLSRCFAFSTNNEVPF